MPTRNLRKGRASITGSVYSITTVSFQRKRIFHELPAARAVISGLRYCDEKRYSRTLAFVVMPDHVHWLFQLGEIAELSKVINAFKGMAGHQLKAVGGGRIWQSGYYDHALRSEEDMKVISRYIIANPLRAGLVKRIGDYPWWDAVWVDAPDFVLS